VPPFVVDDLETQFAKVEELGQKLRTQLYNVHKLQDEFEASFAKQQKNLKVLKTEYKGAVDTKTSTVLVNDPGKTNQQEPKSVQLTKYKEQLRDFETLMPTNGGFFVRAYLGPHNVRFYRKKERMLFKQDYELFKQNLSPVIIVFCLVALYFHDNRWIHMLFQLFLAYYYVNLSLRENILRKNGSNIKGWWIAHHYISMAAAVVLLTWPSSESYSLFANDLHLFGLYMGVVQIFQTRYQLSRLYTLRSLGKASEMDVSNSDSTIHWSIGISVLLPIIIMGQVFQCYIAVSLFKIYAMYPKEYQVLLCGLLFLSMFLGNSSTTVITLLEKKHILGSQPKKTN